MVRLPVQWRQGEHLAIIGDTGTGKTTLAAALLRTRGHVISLKTKADDTKLPGTVIRDVRGLDDTRQRYFVFYPPYEHQARRLAELFERVWVEGGWTVYVDELFYLHGLHRAMRAHVDRLLTQGRSKGITVVMSMQRPVSVTRFALSQATHVISFRLDGRDAKLLSDATTPRIREVVNHLERWYFAWYYRPERRILRGTLRDLEAR